MGRVLVSSRVRYCYWGTGCWGLVSSIIVPVLVPSVPVCACLVPSSFVLEGSPPVPLALRLRLLLSPSKPKSLSLAVFGFGFWPWLLRLPVALPSPSRSCSYPSHDLSVTISPPSSTLCVCVSRSSTQIRDPPSPSTGSPSHSNSHTFPNSPSSSSIFSSSPPSSQPQPSNLTLPLSPLQSPPSRFILEILDTLTVGLLLVQLELLFSARQEHYPTQPPPSGNFGPESTRPLDHPTDDSLRPALIATISRRTIVARLPIWSCFAITFQSIRRPGTTT